jgi:hypothetical protein
MPSGSGVGLTREKFKNEHAVKILRARAWPLSQLCQLKRRGVEVIEMLRTIKKVTDVGVRFLFPYFLLPIHPFFTRKRSSTSAEERSA